MPNNELIPVTQHSLEPIFERAIANVREDIMDNPYLAEALRVLPVGGYRSAIGSFWNAVVDDLRNKILFRSVKLFNKAVDVRREVKTYEDFQNHVTDDELIDGAYKIGVIGWEASKILKHAKETRHIFDGHPRSTDPSIIKVLAMFEDCAKYVLNEPYAPQIVDIDEYIALMATPNFDRNEVAIANALTELPEVYKRELVNRLFTAYIHENATSDLRSNIELTAPILWPVLPKELKIQVVRRVDQVIIQGNAAQTKEAFTFVRLVNATAYLNPTAKHYIVKPLVERLTAYADNLENFEIGDQCIRGLAPYASNIPDALVSAYVSALVRTYVGYVGSSGRYARTDFYANGAAARIPKMVEAFDDTAAVAFVDCLRTNSTLRRRIENPVKLNRLRSLANIVLGKVSAAFTEKNILEALADEARQEEFWALLRRA
jgi:hypothetical protein